MRTSVRAALATVVLMAGTLFATEPVRAGFPGGNGRIAFTSDRDGNPEIYSMSATGSDQRNLTRHSAMDTEANWAPDGSKIAFTSDRDTPNAWDVFVMKADGTGVVNLTKNPALDWNPAWSPTGAKIAFTSYRAGGGEIFVMNADGTGVDQLTDNGFYDRHPAWSPDGTRIAFESYRDGSWEIMVMNSNGTGETQLTHDDGYDFEPDWSPDSSRITWRTGQYDGVGDIAVMNADGTGATNLTQGDPAYDREPAWAPDGSRIAYASVQTDNFDIRTMSPTGTGRVTITSHPGNDYDPDWQALPFTLTVTKLGSGTGAVLSRPAGVRCGPDCSQSYAAGTVVKLRAFPGSGSTFTGWGGSCSGTGVCTLTMNASKNVTGTFAGA